jgi:hypothetical protein
VKKRQIRSNRRRRKSRRTRTRKKKKELFNNKKNKIIKTQTQRFKQFKMYTIHGNRERKDLVVLGQGHKDINFSLFGGEIANSQKMVSQIQNSMFQKRWCISITQIN